MQTKLRQEIVYGYVRDPESGRKVRSFKHGQVVQLRSHDEGKTWFMRLDSLLAVRRRKAQIDVLTDREKNWIAMVELPWSGHDLKLALRFSGGAQ